MTLRFLFLALLALGAVQAEAQSLKVGVIDPDLIVTRMPEYAQVQGEMSRILGEVKGFAEKASAEVKANGDLTKATKEKVDEAVWKHRKTRTLFPRQSSGPNVMVRTSEPPCSTRTVTP